MRQTPTSGRGGLEGPCSHASPRTLCTGTHWADGRRSSLAHHQLVPARPHFLHLTPPLGKGRPGPGRQERTMCDSKANSASPHQPCSRTPGLSASSQGKALGKATFEAHQTPRSGGRCLGSIITTQVAPSHSAGRPTRIKFPTWANHVPSTLSRGCRMRQGGHVSPAPDSSNRCCWCVAMEMPLRRKLPRKNARSCCDLKTEPPSQVGPLGHVPALCLRKHPGS